ncbi:hypothetical protein AX016_1257 [Cellulophaga sp. RHA19]|uniref:hypothetical protein n=1 Tax=Cellulophaga sp. RHA19 TaxID=1798237 RepID=UPI000C2C86F4|nr:hypothetical protein [Cellulophaga sp. RHA19]PKB43074.1 hypothetical protein AX016_1257 [Cellulophaga sp. RHA19]
MKHLYLTIALLFTLFNAYSQQTLSEIIKKNTSTFHYQDNQFKGDGWEEILGQIKEHKNVLIGEDHFFNEIPLFISKATSQVKFDNFFCEIDPYSAKIIEQKIHTLNENELTQYVSDLSNNLSFSFYSMVPEFNMLKDLVQANTNIIGTDQIMLTADKLMAIKLLEITKNEVAKTIYEDIKKRSDEHFQLFINKKGGPYFFSEKFEQNLKKLETLKLSLEEKLIIKDLKLSREIYITQNHYLRIQLMKNNVFKNIELLKEHKNLFKYGAIHINKGESILGGYDIGNFVSNITDANFDSSLHVMIIGKNGTQGIPFSKEVQKIDLNSKDLKHYSVFFENTEGKEWHLFNTSKILKGVNSNKIKIDNKVLLKTLKGFDYIIVIPEVSAALNIN